MQLIKQSTKQSEVSTVLKELQKQRESKLKRQEKGFALVDSVLGSSEDDKGNHNFSKTKIRYLRYRINKEKIWRKGLAQWQAKVSSYHCTDVVGLCQPKLMDGYRDKVVRGLTRALHDQGLI